MFIAGGTFLGSKTSIFTLRIWKCKSKELSPSFPVQDIREPTGSSQASNPPLSSLPPFSPPKKQGVLAGPNSEGKSSRQGSVILVVVARLCLHDLGHLLSSFYEYSVPAEDCGGLAMPKLCREGDQPMFSCNADSYALIEPRDVFKRETPMGIGWGGSGQGCIIINRQEHNELPTSLQLKQRPVGGHRKVARLPRRKATRLHNSRPNGNDGSEEITHLRRSKGLRLHSYRTALPVAPRENPLNCLEWPEPCVGMLKPDGVEGRLFGPSPLTCRASRSSLFASFDQRLPHSYLPRDF